MKKKKPELASYYKQQIEPVLDSAICSKFDIQIKLTHGSASTNWINIKFGSVLKLLKILEGEIKK